MSEHEQQADDVTVDTVVWDMGGVFRQFPTEAMVEHGRRHGWPIDRLPLGPTGPFPDPAYATLRRGDIDEEEYFAVILGALEGAGITFDPKAQERGFYRERASVWALIDELTDDPDRRQAILTNDATAWRGERWWEAWDEAYRFEVIVDCGVLGTKKPEPRPYEEVLARLDTAPERCVFIDDAPRNVDAAQQLGMHGVVLDLTDPDAAVGELRQRLGL